jgi:hypothetical protein
MVDYATGLVIDSYHTAKSLPATIMSGSLFVDSLYRMTVGVTKSSTYILYTFNRLTSGTAYLEKMSLSNGASVGAII